MAGISIAKISSEKENKMTMAEVKEHILSIAETATPQNIIDVTVELDQGTYTVEEPVATEPGISELEPLFFHIGV